jgi:hypothetical protein
MKLLTAKIKFAAGKTFPGKRGDRQSIKLEFTDGSEADVWFNAGDRRYCQLRRGETVQVLREGDKFTVVTDDEDDDGTPPTPQATPAALANTPEPPSVAEIRGLVTTSDEARAQIFQELCKRAQVLKSCHVQIVSLFTAHDGTIVVSEEAIQEYTCTLYLDLARYWK